MSKIINVIFAILFFNNVLCQSSIPTSSQFDLENYLWSYARNKCQGEKKHLINFNTIDNWQQLGSYLSISNNGQYLAYNIDNTVGIGSSIIIQSARNGWRRSFTDGKPGFFTSNNDQYIFQKQDTLYFVQLGTRKCKVVNNVESYIFVTNKNDWIAYKLKGNNRVILQNLFTRSTRELIGVSNFSFDDSEQWFKYELNTSPNKVNLLNLNSNHGHNYHFAQSFLVSPNGNALMINNGSSLLYIDLAENISKVIWEATDSLKTLAEYHFDQSGKQAVFIVKDLSPNASNSIWYYEQGMEMGEIKLYNSSSALITDSAEIHESASFTDNGHYIKFAFKYRAASINVLPKEAKLQLFSYKDLVLQSNKPNRSEQFKIYQAVVSVKNNQVVLLENDKRTLHSLNGHFALVKRNGKEMHGDRFWELDSENYEDSNWIVSLKDGSSRLLPTNTNYGLWFSPSGNYLVYFDPRRGCHYFSYNLHTAKLNDVSENVTEGLLAKVDPTLATVEKSAYPYCLGAWLKDDAGLLVYDSYDIWRLDLAGEKPAVNITNRHGFFNSLIFTLFYGGRNVFETPILSEDETLTLRAFNTKNKYNGFYQRADGTARDPEQLSIGPFFISMIKGCHDPNLSNIGKPPLKALDADVWIVQRQSISDAPNYYKTTDFKSFSRLTSLQPQNQYRWISQELHSFKHLDGKSGQGILYKPENFDQAHKYSVLIIFYGSYSGNFHQFPNPSYIVNAIAPGVSPSWMLNNNCLIFTPDIHVAPFKYGPEAYNVIEGAVNYFKHLPYIDSNKIGCAAHSWSAKLGAYLFTHSRSFAAMSFSEGFLYGNMIDVAFSSDENGKSKLETVERLFQYGKLWEYKELWLDQTTIINVDKSKSPLLLLCNKQSSEEYQNQTFQLFSALRRLEKSVWWLKYDKGGHNLYDLNEQKDYTIRYTQYFDHYLNHAPPPKWMTTSYSYSQRQMGDFFELDPKGSCNKDCPICKIWNQRYKKDPIIFKKKINEWKFDD